MKVMETCYHCGGTYPMATHIGLYLQSDRTTLPICQPFTGKKCLFEYKKDEKKTPQTTLPGL